MRILTRLVFFSRAVLRGSLIGFILCAFLTLQCAAPEDVPTSHRIDLDAELPDWSADPFQFGKGDTIACPDTIWAHRIVITDERHVRFEPGMEAVGPVIFLDDTDTGLRRVFLFRWTGSTEP